MKTAAASRAGRGRAHGGLRPRPTALLSLVFLGIITTVGLFLLTRTSASSVALGQQHTLGVASAPVVVEEWSDFE